MHIKIEINESGINIIENTTANILINEKLPNRFLEYLTFLRENHCRIIDFKYLANNQFYTIKLKKRDDFYLFECNEFKDTDDSIVELSPKTRKKETSFRLRNLPLEESRPLFNEDTDDLLSVPVITSELEEGEMGKLITSILYELRAIKKELNASERWQTKIEDSMSDWQDSLELKIEEKMNIWQQTIDAKLTNAVDRITFLDLILRMPKSQAMIFIVLIVTGILIFDNSTVKKTVDKIKDDPLELVK